MAIIFFMCCGLYLCYTDIRYRIIRNYTIVAYFLACLILLRPGVLDLNYVFSFSCLFFGFIAFFIRIIGAGDIKLLFIISLFIDKKEQMEFVLIMTMLGALIAVFYLIYPLLVVSFGGDSTKTKKRGVPYGVPLFLAHCIFLLSM